MYIDGYFQDGTGTRLDISTNLEQSIAFGFFHLMWKAAGEEKRKENEEAALNAIIGLAFEILEGHGLSRAEQMRLLDLSNDDFAEALALMPTNRFIKWMMETLQSQPAGRRAA